MSADLNRLKGKYVLLGTLGLKRESYWQQRRKRGFQIKLILERPLQHLSWKTCSDASCLLQS